MSAKLSTKLVEDASPREIRPDESRPDEARPDEARDDEAWEVEARAEGDGEGRSAWKRSCVRVADAPAEGERASTTSLPYEARVRTDGSGPRVGEALSIVST